MEGAMAETRRLAAIMAIDVVGYSRLMGENEAGTARAVREHRDAARPLVASRGGRIVKTMGDGLLLEFSSVVDAVACAVAIQKLMVERNAGTPLDKSIVYRIGVNLGDVLIEGEDILGEGVNIAARLEGVCEPGGVLISGSAFDHVRGRIDVDFVDLGEKELKNIARPVRAYRVTLDRDGSKSGTSASDKPTVSLAPPDKPSIAVLAFQNMSGDPEQEYFADGMVDDLITGLSRIKWLFVIARNSSFVYKGRAVDVRQVGRELGVRYVLEGGVRKSGNRVRINAQLLEAETGAHLWADKFDGALENVFDLQDQITERVVGVVEPSVQRQEIERSRRKHPGNLGAYDLYLRALPHMASVMPVDARVAKGFLEDALRKDPDYAPAHALMAWCHEILLRSSSDGAEREAGKTAGLQHARVAIASGTDDAAALAIAANVIVHLSKDNEAALSAIERALALNPSSAAAHYFGAHIHAYSGHAAVATALANRALRLSPFDPWTYEAYMTLGIVATQEARYDDAASWLAKATQANPGFSSAHSARAIALALAGRLEEAKPHMRKALELEPGGRISMIYQIGLDREIADKYAAGARLLGVPE
jgi:adenylate cyclase